MTLLQDISELNMDELRDALLPMYKVGLDLFNTHSMNSMYCSFFERVMTHVFKDAKFNSASDLWSW